MKMGWQLVGNLRPWVRLDRPGALPALARSRVPADHWATPTTVGSSAAEVLADDLAIDELLSSVPPSAGIETRRSPGFLRWRYAAEPLGYRVVVAGDDPSQGIACFRLRRRGPALEAMVGDVLVPGARTAPRRALVRRILRATKADYALCLRGRFREGFAPLPEPGPTLVWRAVRDRQPPSHRQWHVTMGDIELF
jgi:hypothetical protein